jgi:hypothetical protein
MGLLDIYSDYLISQNGYETATGLSSMLDGQISHDKITSFLNTGSSTSKDLWLQVKPTLRKIEQSKGGVLVIDDSIEEKPYTDENELVNWHYSHAKHRSIKGINLMSCLVIYDDTTLKIEPLPLVANKVDEVRAYIFSNTLPAYLEKPKEKQREEREKISAQDLLSVRGKLFE